MKQNTMIAAAAVGVSLAVVCAIAGGPTTTSVFAVICLGCLVKWRQLG